VLVGACAPRRAAAPPTRPSRTIAAHSLGGAPIEVFTCGQGPGGLLVIGGTHGDERGSALLVRELVVRLACPATPVTIVWAVNPDGLATARRANARGVDLNRNLPTRSWTARATHGSGPLSEPESRALYDVILRARPSFTLSVHEGSDALVDYDGPAATAAAALATCTGLPVERLGARPGSLGSLIGVDWGLPLVTLELPRWTSRLDADQLWARYGPCLLYAVATHARLAPDANGLRPASEVR